MLEHPIEPTVLTMEKSVGLGNQQERLAFLAGLIEGEGTISVQTSNTMTNGKKALLPILLISNTNKELIEFAAQTLREIGINPFIYWSKRKGNKVSSGRIQINGYNRLIKFLPMIYGLLVSKKKQAEVVYRLCARRVTMSRFRYTEEDFRDVKEVRELNIKPSTQKARILNEHTSLKDYSL